MSRVAPSRRELRRLHEMNALCAALTGHDLYLAQQIVAAITFSLAELAAQKTAAPELARTWDADFSAAAALLLGRLYASGPRHGFFHWDAALTPESATPLFARAELMAGLRQLAPFREATLLVTNLRPALLPAARRQSPRRRREYAEALGFVRALAAARTRRTASLQLIFL